MSSQDEVMRLSAEIVNRWSGPLNDMRRDLRKLSDDVKGTHGAGAAHAQKHSEAVRKLRSEFQRLDEHVKTTSIETMAAFGVTALSVAGAVAAVKDAVFGFGDSTRQLRFLSRETGLAIDQLRQYEALARRVGAAPGAMSKGFQDFAQHMQNIRRLAPAEMNAWKNEWGKNGNEFILRLGKMNNPEALSAAIGYLDKIPDQQDKRKWLRMLGLPENFANVPVAELRKAMGGIQKSLVPLGPDAEKAGLKFEAALDRMSLSVENLKLKVGSELAGAFADATDQISKFVDENRDGLTGVLKGVSAEIGNVLKDVREIMREYQKLRTGDWKGAGLDPHIVPGSPLDKGKDVLDWLSKHSGQGQRLWDHLQAPSNIPPGVDFMPMAYRPGDGGLRSGGGFTMLGAGASSGSPEEVIAKGTYAGVLQALREFRYEVEGGGGAGGAGGLTPAAYHPGGGGGMSAGSGNAVRRLLSSGANPSGIPSSGMRRFSVGDIHSALFGTGGGEGPGSAVQNAGIASARARFAAELSDPNKRMEFAAMLLSEGSPLPTAESAMNRSLYANSTLTQMLHSDFYGPINRGQLPAFMDRLRRDPALMGQMNDAINQALAGSDVIRGATDQGMPSDPNGRWPGGRMSIGGNVFNDWGGGPGGHAGAARWREAFEAMSHRGTGGVWAAPGYSAEMYSPFGLHGDALRRHFGYRGHGGEALRSGKQSGLYTGNKLEGNASLDIRFENPPKGMRSKLAFGGLFKEVKLNRGRTMVPASQDG